MKIFQKHRLLLLPACSRCSRSPRAAAATVTGPGGQRNAPSAITVLADSSLKNAFTQLGKQFESQNPGSTVTFTYGSSADLANRRWPATGRRARDHRPAEHGRAQKAQLNSPSVFATKGSDQCQIVTLTQAKNTSLSTQFINLVLSQSGQQVAAAGGFGAP